MTPYSWSNRNRGRDWMGCIMPVAVIGFICAVAFAILLAVAGRFTGVRWQYSDGERVGTVYKLSKKGYVWKTYEGELNLGGVSTDSNGIMVPNAWEFSVRPKDEEEVLPKLQAAMKTGHRVTITYTQYAISPISWGNTQYYITDVTDNADNTPEKKK